MGASKRTDGPAELKRTNSLSYIGLPSIFFVVFFIIIVHCEDVATKRSYLDDSIDSYFSERTCWWNEVCKREFQVRFRCRCPKWSFCRSPGRYYDAYCSITRTGYIWYQQEPEPDD